MKCIIPGTGVKAFGKCVHCLTKLGDEIFIETSNDTLALKTVNSARSGFACFVFKRSFFSSFKCQNNVSCKMLTKSIVSVFRGLSTLEKSVDYFTVELDSVKDKIVFIFHCKYGIKKTHQLGFEDCEALMAVYSKEDETVNRIIQCSKPLQEALTSFNMSVSEVNLSINESCMQLSNYINEDEDSGHVLRSLVTLYPDEFEDYQSDVESVVTFCLKELRAILSFTSSLVTSLTVQFDTPGKPIIFSIDDNPTYTADFVLATLADPADSENYQTLSQHTQSTATKRPSHMTSTTSHMTSATNHNVTSSQTNGHSSEDRPMIKSQPSIGMGPSQNRNESHIPIDLTCDDEDIQDDIALGTSYHDNTSCDDFVVHKETHSHSKTSHTDNPPTQDSILENSAYLPSTPPPPSKRFKPYFSVLDMFGVQAVESNTILAPDSDEED